MRSPTHATLAMNAYAMSARFCAYADRSCNRLWALETLPDVLSNVSNSVIPEQSPRLEKGGDTTIQGGYKWFKTQSLKEGSQGTQSSLSRVDVFIASQMLRTTMKDLRNWTWVQPQRGTNIKGQSKSVQQSHFEPEAADHKSHPLETTVAKENMDEMWNKTKTKILSYSWLHRTSYDKTK